MQNNPQITNKKIEALYNKSLKYSLENCVKILSKQSINMKNILKLILIFPILLELLDSSRFVIELPIPLSFARVLLLFLSFYFILGNIFKIFSDRIFNSF